MFNPQLFEKYKDFKVSEVITSVIHVEINKPRQVNSFSSRTWHEYREIIKQLNDLDDVSVIVLSGAGEHFCSGIDLKSFTELGSSVNDEFIQDFQSCINAPIYGSVPVISISHGINFGLALDIVSAATIRLATKDARFSVKEIDVGIIADIGSLQRLPHVVSNISKLSEYCLTAREFSGIEAKELGLVSDVFEDKAQAFNYALTLASNIHSKYKPAVIGTKKHLELMTTNSELVKEGLNKVAADNAALMSEVSFKKHVSRILSGRASRKRGGVPRL